MSKPATIRPKLFTRRQLKWAGLAVTVVLVAVMVASWFVWYKHVWATPKYERLIWVAVGGVMYTRIERDPPGNVFMGRTFVNGFSSSRGMSPVWWPQYQPLVPSGSMSLLIPLWPLLLLTVLPTAWLWRVDRRAKAWECRKCRYDLRGLDGDICPECGSKRTSTCASNA